MIKNEFDQVLRGFEGNTSKKWIEYSDLVGWPGGMPYNERKSGEPVEDSGRQAFIYQVDANKYLIFTYSLGVEKEFPS